MVAAHEEPRRRSKLVGRHPAEQPAEPAEDNVRDLRGADAGEAPPSSTQGSQTGASTEPPGPVSRNPRRLRPAGKPSDTDMVSFNCKMSRGLRRQVRHFAADSEVDIQDVVAAALAEYLTVRGTDVPPSELRRPD